MANDSMLEARAKEHLKRKASITETRAYKALSYIVQRNNRYIATPRSENFPLLNTPEKVTIAILSFPLDLDDDFDRENGSDNLLLDYALVIPKDHARDSIKTLIIAEAEKAAKYHPDLLFLNELAFPYWERAAGEDFINHVLDRFGDKKPYIIGGTYHCKDSKMNLAPLSAPGGSHLLHAKKTSAAWVGERIRVPFNRNIRLYNTPYGRIGILICLDCYDASQIVSWVGHNFSADEHDRLDLLIIPSFGMPNLAKFEEACSDLSFLLRCAVGVACSDGYSSQQWTFVCGKPIAPVASESEHCSIFTLNKTECDALRYNADNEIPEEVRFVFGERRGDYIADFG